MNEDNGILHQNLQKITQQQLDALFQPLLICRLCENFHIHGYPYKRSNSNNYFGLFYLLSTKIF